MSGTPREPRASPPGIPRRGRIPSRCAAVITATLGIAGLLAFAASAPASATVLPPAFSQATPAHHPSAGPAISAFDPATGQLVLYGTDRPGRR
jgi:hypothetical protein